MLKMYVRLFYETIHFTQTSTLELFILLDNHSYSQTISMLSTIDPSEVLPARHRLLHDQ